MGSQSGGSKLEKAYLINSDKSQNFYFQFNPKDFTLKEAAEYEDEKTFAVGAPVNHYKKHKPASVDLTVYFDTSDTGDSVATKYVDKLRGFLKPDIEETVKNEKVKRPAHAVFAWKDFRFECVITKVDTQYLMFKADGTPLRAKVTLGLNEHKWNPGTFGAQAADNVTLAGVLSSNKTATFERKSDAIAGNGKTSTYTTKSGDTVTSVAQQTGADPKDIAMANDIDDMMELEVGIELVIPFSTEMALALAAIAAAKVAVMVADAVSMEPFEELPPELADYDLLPAFDDEHELAAKGVKFHASGGDKPKAGAGKDYESKHKTDASAGKGAKGTKKDPAKIEHKDAKADEIEKIEGAKFEAKKFDEHESGEGADFEAKKFDAPTAGAGAKGTKKDAAEVTHKEAKADETEKIAGKDFEAKKFDAPAAGAGAKGEKKEAAEISHKDAKADETEKIAANTGERKKPDEAPQAGAGAKGEKKEAAEISHKDAKADAVEKIAGNKGESKSKSDSSAGSGAAGESKSSTDASAGHSKGGKPDHSHGVDPGQAAAHKAAAEAKTAASKAAGGSGGGGKDGGGASGGGKAAGGSSGSGGSGGGSGPGAAPGGPGGAKASGGSGGSSGGSSGGGASGGGASGGGASGGGASGGGSSGGGSKPGGAAAASEAVSATDALDVVKEVVEKVDDASS